MANGNLSIYIVLMETCVSITLILKNVKMKFELKILINEKVSLSLIGKGCHFHLPKARESYNP